jgi:hypothetical protein
MFAVVEAVPISVKRIVPTTMEWIVLLPMDKAKYLF